MLPCAKIVSIRKPNMKILYGLYNDCAITVFFDGLMMLKIT